MEGLKKVWLPTIGPHCALMTTYAILACAAVCRFSPELRCDVTSSIERDAATSVTVLRPQLNGAHQSAMFYLDRRRRLNE